MLWLSIQMHLFGNSLTRNCICRRQRAEISYIPAHRALAEASTPSAHEGREGERAKRVGRSGCISANGHRKKDEKSAERLKPVLRPIDFIASQRAPNNLRIRRQKHAAKQSPVGAGERQIRNSLRCQKCEFVCVCIIYDLDELIPFKFMAPILLILSHFS